MTTDHTEHDDAHHRHAHHQHYFDEAAAEWDDDPAKLKLADDLTAAIGAAVPLTPSWVALDFGGGTGQLSQRLATQVAAVDLVDTSAGMLEVASKRFADEPKISPYRLDLAADPAPRDHYDLITASLSLHHVPDTGAVLDAFARLLSPGGWAAIAELAADPRGDFHGHIENFDGHHGFRPEDLAGQLTARGFTEVGHVEYGAITKDIDGTPRDFPVHLITGRAPQN